MVRQSNRGRSVIPSASHIGNLPASEGLYPLVERGPSDRLQCGAFHRNIRGLERSTRLLGGWMDIRTIGDQDMLFYGRNPGAYVEQHARYARTLRPYSVRPRHDLFDRDW